MNLKIIENNRSEIFKRNDIVAEFDQKTIPKREEIRKNISAQINKPSEKIVVRKINTNFGTTKGQVIVKVYDDKENLKKIESSHIQKRNEEKVVENKTEENSENSKEEVKSDENKTTEDNKKEENKKE